MRDLLDLELADNQIMDLGPLAGLTNLAWLNLDYNQIVDLGPLAGLTDLTWLDFDNNQITDLDALLLNPGLGADDYVDLRGNPLSTRACNEVIPALEARGVDVAHDCGLETAALARSQAATAADSEAEHCRDHLVEMEHRLRSRDADASERGRVAEKLRREALRCEKRLDKAGTP